jgi:aspartate oxidase
MSNPAAVEQLVREGPRIVKQFLIDELGVEFDRDQAGKA